MYERSKKILLGQNYDDSVLFGASLTNLPAPVIAFNFLSINARSLYNKPDELPQLATLASHTFPRVIAVCKTWCSPLEPDTSHNIHNYTMHRCDRSHSRGGGVILHVHDTSQHELVDECHMDGCESLWIRVQTHKQSLTVGCT